MRYCWTPMPIDEASSPAALKLLRILRALLVSQLCFSALNMLFDLSFGLRLLLGALLLCSIQRCRYYFPCVFYIILSAQQCYLTVLLFCQVVGYATVLTSVDLFILTVQSLIVPFLLISIYYTFLIYREFKGSF